jgi:hypothetical protein
MSSVPRAPLSDSARATEEIDAAREIHQELATEWTAASSYAIPGMSTRPDSCGNWYPYHVCDECGQPIFSESHCGLRKCPECWYQWVRDTAEKIVTRIQAYRWAQDDGLDRRLIHGLFSPEQEENWTVSRVDGMRKDSYEKADDAGITGGCALLHLWRTTDDLDEEFRAATEAGVADKKWKYIRETYGKGWRRAVEVSPHVHQIAVAPEFEPEKDDWVAKRVRTLDSMKSLSHPSSYEDVAGLAMYLLSHTAIADGEQALRWFGNVYPGGFNPEEELSSGALDTIERMAAEAVEPDGEDDDDDVEQLPEEPECEAGTPDCPGQPMPIWDVPSARRRNWWGDLDRGIEKKLSVACEWMMGDLDPPPARSEGEARELLEKMVEM